MVQVGQGRLFLHEAVYCSLNASANAVYCSLNASANQRLLWCAQLNSFRPLLRQRLHCMDTHSCSWSSRNTSRVDGLLLLPRCVVAL